MALGICSVHEMTLVSTSHFVHHCFISFLQLPFLSMSYSLAIHGDGAEKDLYSSLIQPSFPSYEVFWQKFVIPLTNRPSNIQIRTDSSLAEIGKTPHDVCLAQLHYSVLRHLGRAHALRQNHAFGLDHLIFTLSAIVGAQDVAFELLERFRNQASYDPWLGTRS